MTAPELLARNAAKGLEVRTARSDLRRELKAGTAKLSDVLYAPTLPEYLRTWNLEDLLQRVPYLPQKTIDKWLQEIPIKPTASVSEPTYRKRREVVARLKDFEVRSAERSGGKRARPHAHVSGAGARHLSGKGSS